LRSAYGIFYNHANRLGREGLLGFNPPFIILADSNILGSGVLRDSDAIFRLRDGIPAGFVDISRVNLATVARKAQDPNQRSPYVQQYNFGIQQELVKGLVLDVAYVGNHGVKLPSFRNLNPNTYSFNSQGLVVVGPRELASLGFLGDIQILENLGRSNYNSLIGNVHCDRHTYPVPRPKQRIALHRVPSPRSADLRHIGCGRP
jgi:hypothetical protein